MWLPASHKSHPRQFRPGFGGLGRQFGVPGGRGNLPGAIGAQTEPVNPPEGQGLVLVDTPAEEAAPVFTATLVPAAAASTTSPQFSTIVPNRLPIDATIEAPVAPAEATPLVAAPAPIAAVPEPISFAPQPLVAGGVEPVADASQDLFTVETINLEPTAVASGIGGPVETAAAEASAGVSMGGIAFGSIASVAFLFTVIFFFYKWKKGTLGTLSSAKWHLPSWLLTGRSDPDYIREKRLSTDQPASERNDMDETRFSVLERLRNTVRASWVTSAKPSSFAPGNPLSLNPVAAPPPAMPSKPEPSFDSNVGTIEIGLATTTSIAQEAPRRVLKMPGTMSTASPTASSAGETERSSVFSMPNSENAFNNLSAPPSLVRK